MHDLIIAALQERRIDRTERFHPARRKPCGEGHPVLLGDADIETTAREALCKQVQPRPIGHRSSDCGDLVIMLRRADQAVSKDFGVARRV